MILTVLNPIYNESSLVLQVFGVFQSQAVWGCWDIQFQRAPFCRVFFPLGLGGLFCVSGEKPAEFVATAVPLLDFGLRTVCSPHALHISELSLVDKDFPISLFHYLLPALTSDVFTFSSLVLSEQWAGTSSGTMEAVICRGFNYIHTWGKKEHFASYKLSAAEPCTHVSDLLPRGTFSGGCLGGSFKCSGQHHSPGFLERVALAWLLWSQK